MGGGKVKRRTERRKAAKPKGRWILKALNLYPTTVHGLRALSVAQEWIWSGEPWTDDELDKRLDQTAQRSIHDSNAAPYGFEGKG